MNLSLHGREMLLSGILKQNAFKVSDNKDLSMGRGVYFTRLDPSTSDQALLENNYSQKYIQHHTSVTKGNRGTDTALGLKTEELVGGWSSDSSDNLPLRSQWICFHRC